jgi:small subunit ribosomal protein S9
MAGHALALSVPFASLSLQETNMTCFTSSSAAVAKRSFLSGVSLRPCVVVNAPLRMRKAQSVVGLAMASAAAAAPAITEEGEGSLEQWVRQMLPGGFAAQRLIGTGRRKTAVARVVLIDGTGQIIINNRTAQVLLFALLSFFFSLPYFSSMPLSLFEQAVMSLWSCF